MLRQAAKNPVFTFFSALNDEMDIIHEDFPLPIRPYVGTLAGLLCYAGSLYFAFKYRTEDRTPIAEVTMLPFSILLLTAVTLRATLIAIEAGRRNPNVKIIDDFFKNNPEHPNLKKDETPIIDCPILCDSSATPVCLKFTAGKTDYVHAYDYYELKKYFLSESSTKCLFTSYNLLDTRTVKNLQLSFEIPDNTPEKILSEQQTLSISRR